MDVDDENSTANSALIKGTNCTKLIPSESPKGQNYLLRKAKSGVAGHSFDCRLAEQIIEDPSGAVEIIIADVTPESFAGAKECNRVSFTPPSSDGSKESLSEEIRRAPFDVQVYTSTFALSLRECRNRVFPSLSAEGPSRFDSIGMHSLTFLYEKAGFDPGSVDLVDANGLLTQVVPFAISRHKGKLHTIACARIIYARDPDNLPLKTAQSYKACLSNFAEYLAAIDSGHFIGRPNREGDYRGKRIESD